MIGKIYGKPWVDDYHALILQLPPNRVRRNYIGGALLNNLEGKTELVDSNKPEDWIASTIEAKNPGLPPIRNEGLSKVISRDGDRILLKKLFEHDPAFYLGAEHLQIHSLDLGFLIKMLDAGIRLNVQAHPSRDFAREHLDSPHGKLECYYILDVRPGISPYIRVGFQHAPTRDEFYRIVKEQDIDAMDACFEPVPVKPGDVWYIPGGVPHAIGEGLLLIEIMEPSDLVARYEFDREGMIVPPPARFMGRNLDFALDLLDFSEFTIEQANSKFKLKPKIEIDEKNLKKEILIDDNQTDCFKVIKISARNNSSFGLIKKEHILVGIGVRGSGVLSLKAGDISIEVFKGSKFLIPAATDTFDVRPMTDTGIDLLFVMPTFGDLQPA
ncbi:MAG: class I mannose-6-phosphate isomerase [Promethearchaeota archaeon]